ncbi:hypothetical protein EV174_004549, partial [Coemansia sp. RSA 2320]
MSAFLSSLLGRKLTAIQDSEPPSCVVYDLVPRLEPAPGQHVDRCPEPTLEEQQAIDLINDQHRSSLLAGLPQEPSDFRPKLDANAWLTSERILIYLRSSKGDSGRAVKRLR